MTKLSINSETKYGCHIRAGQGEAEKMDKKNKLPATVFAALILVAALQGCASTGEPVPAMTPSQQVLSASESVAASKETLTFENLLRWPLEGPSGIDRTIASLRQSFGVMEERTGEGLHGGGPVTLSDGYVLESTTVYPNDGTIHVQPEQKPCFSPERAAEITGAIMDPLFRTDHGVDTGRSYDARRNGVWVNFISTPETYECVYAIHIRAIGEAQP